MHTFRSIFVTFLVYLFIFTVSYSTWDSLKNDTKVIMVNAYKG